MSSTHLVCTLIDKHLKRSRVSITLLMRGGT